MKLLAYLLILGCAVAGAQEYPNKPVRMVVGFPPGGGTDVVARILQPRLTELLGQTIVIDNRPGATGTVAAGQVAKAAPDGYTIMMGHVSVNAIAPSLFPNLPYDVNRDFAPLALAPSVPLPRRTCAPASCARSRSPLRSACLRFPKCRPLKKPASRATWSPPGTGYSRQRERPRPSSAGCMPRW